MDTYDPLSHTLRDGVCGPIAHRALAAASLRKRRGWDLCSWRRRFDLDLCIERRKVGGCGLRVRGRGGWWCW